MSTDPSLDSGRLLTAGRRLEDVSLVVSYAITVNSEAAASFVTESFRACRYYSKF